MKRLLLLAAAASLMAACGEATTAPSASKKQASPRANHDDEITCRSGYILAFDENGNPICIPDPNGAGGQQNNMSSRPPVP